MKSTFILILLTGTIASVEVNFTLAEESSPLSYSKDFSDWLEIPASTMEAITSDPFFSKVCDWRIDQSELGATPYLLEKRASEWLMLVPRDGIAEDSEAIRPSSTIKLGSGWLVSYNRQRGSEVYWFSSDKTKNHFIANFFVNQFSLGVLDSEILAAVSRSVAPDGTEIDGGVVKFTIVPGAENWSNYVYITSAFGDVYGIEPLWNKGMLLHTEKGLVVFNNQEPEPRIIDFKGNLLSYTTIGSVGRFVFFGGQFSVGELDSESLSVRYLIPSQSFLDALNGMTDLEFSQKIQNSKFD